MTRWRYARYALIVALILLVVVWLGYGLHATFPSSANTKTPVSTSCDHSIPCPAGDAVPVCTETQKKSSDQLTCKAASTTIQIQLTKTERAAFLSYFFTLLKDASKPPPTPAQRQLARTWDKTNQQWADVHYKEAVTHFREMEDRDDSRTKLTEFLKNLVRPGAGLNLLVSVLMLVGILAFTQWLEPRVLPHLDLAMAVAVADAMYDHYNNFSAPDKTHMPEQAVQEMPEKADTPPTTRQRAWSEEAFATGLLREVVMDPRFMKVVHRIDAAILADPFPEVDSSEFYRRLADDRQFRYLLLSVADRRTKWMESVQRVIAEIKSHLQPQPTPPGTSDSTPAWNMRTLALLLGASSLIPSIGQVVSSSRIQSQIEKEHADTKVLVERYLPAPAAQVTAATPVVLTQTDKETTDNLIERILPGPESSATPTPVTVMNYIEDASPKTENDDPGSPRHVPKRGDSILVHFPSPPGQGSYSARCIAIHYSDNTVRSFILVLSLTNDPELAQPITLTAAEIEKGSTCPNDSDLGKLAPNPIVKPPAGVILDKTNIDAVSFSKAEMYNACLDADVSMADYRRKYLWKLWRTKTLTVKISPKER